MIRFRMSLKKDFTLFQAFFESGRKQEIVIKFVKRMYKRGALMDQNENKNVELESVEKKATEVKEEVVEAAEKTAEEVKEVAETAKEEVSEAKNPEADGDFKEVVENVKEKAGEATEKAKEVAGVAKEKMEEAAKKVFTEENKEKMSQAVDTVASYNKNSLFEKIFFGFSVAIALFSGLVVLNGLGYALKGNALSSVDFYEVSNKVKNLNLYFSLTFFLTIIATVFVAYFLFMANKSKKNLWTNVNVTSLAMVVSVYLAHLLGGGFISLIGTMTDMFNGKVNTSISNLVMQVFTDPNHATKQAMSLVNSFESGSKLAVLFYIVACAAAIVTSYFYYQKLFQKKD